MNMDGSRGGGRGSGPPFENHKLPYVSLEILVRTPREAIGPLKSPLDSIASLAAHLTIL